MAVKLGIAPIAWSNDDLPQLGGETPLETCLAEMHQAGYAGTETGGKYPMDADQLGPILARHELALVSGWFSGDLRNVTVEQEKRRIEQQLTTFARLGAPVIVYAETSGSVQGEQNTPVSQRPRMAGDEYAPYGEKLTAIAEHVAAHGVQMAYHHHMGTVIETEDEVDALMDATGDAVGLTIDTGHIHFAGGDAENLLRRHARRVRHVHTKDIRADVLADVRSRERSFLDGVLDGVFTVPGDGCLDFGRYTKVLADIGYSGWLVVEAEQDPAKANPLEYAIKGRQHLVAALEAADLSITN